MPGPNEVFHSPSGETLIHRERPDGTRDLFIEKPDATRHGHSVIDQYGNVKYTREFDRVIADDKFNK